MKLYLFILLIIPHILFSQDIEKIRDADTIYIYFKNDNFNQIKSLNNRKLKNFTYTFVFDVKEIRPRQSFNIYDAYHNTIPEIKLKRKSFIKKIKNITVDYEILRKLGFFEAEKLLLNKKKLYLIDDDNIYCKKVKIKEVKIISRNYLVPIE